MKTITDELKRCPICDEIPYLNSYPQVSLFRMKPTRYSVECPKCRSCGGIRLTEKEAIESWNELVGDHRGVISMKFLKERENVNTL